MTAVRVVSHRDHADTLQVQRYDQMPAELEPPSRTAQGYARLHAAIAVPGVMEYEDENGDVRRELLLPEELHNVDSLRSLASMPVTLGHPEEDVTPDNVEELGVGDVGEGIEVLSESGHVRVVMVVRSRRGLDAINRGVLEVSPGYVTTLEMTPGVHPIFGQYDAVQRNRRYNHVAIVDQARGGPTVRLRADARRQVTRADSSKLQPGEPLMNPSLLTIALLCGLPVTVKDGKAIRRADNKAYTEDELITAIGDAIRGYIAAAGSAGKGADMEGGEGEAIAAELTAAKAKVAELEGALAAMKSDKANADAAAAKIADEAERKTLDTLAAKLGFDTKTWRADTKTADRKLDLARHKGLVAKDAAPPEPATVNGMISALRTLHGDTSTTTDTGERVETNADAWEAASPKSFGTGTSLSASQPFSSKKDRKADPFKARLESLHTPAATK